MSPNFADHAIADERLLVALLDADPAAWRPDPTGEITAALWRLRHNRLVEWGCWDRYHGRWRAIVVDEKRRDEVRMATHPIPVLTPVGRALALKLVG